MTPVISVQNIAAGYDDKKILKDISFEVQKGEFVGIIGKNGAGKSTLMKCMRGFLPVSSGKVKMLDRFIHEYSDRELATMVAYLQQQVELTFDYTAKDIVTAGRYPYMKWWQQGNDTDVAIVKACMEYTGISDLADNPIRSMSGGQRQRVLLAKVLAQQTPILFLDEPAAGLDLFYQEEIFRFCQELCHRGKTVVMVVHELNLAARYCFRVLLVRDGQVLADGIPDDVFSDSMLTEAYGVPIRAMTNPETGHADIFTEPYEQLQNKKQLLDIIIGERAVV